MLFEKIARIRFVFGVCLFFLVRNVYLYSQSDTFFFSFQVLKTVTQLKDKGQTHASMLLYGHGDGGGGPTWVTPEPYDFVLPVYE